LIEPITKTGVLISEGSSDQALIEILSHLLETTFPTQFFEVVYADPIRFPANASSQKLHQKIATAVSVYPADFYFVHRDADKAGFEKRFQEIEKAWDESKLNFPNVKVIPIRETEAWLLLSSEAIQRAAQNRKASAPPLPKINKIEGIADPKKRLQELLRTACGLKGRRYHQFDVQAAIQKIPRFYLEKDYQKLKQLQSVQHLLEEIVDCLG